MSTESCLLGLLDDEGGVVLLAGAGWAETLRSAAALNMLLPFDALLPFGDSREALRKFRLNLLFFMSCCACCGCSAADHGVGLRKQPAGSCCMKGDCSYPGDQE